jgi:hypothetical protein
MGCKSSSHKEEVQEPCKHPVAETESKRDILDGLVLPEGEFSNDLTLVVEHCYGANQTIRDVNLLKKYLSDVRPRLRTPEEIKLFDEMEECVEKVSRSIYRAIKRIDYSTKDCIVHLKNDSNPTESSLRELMGKELTTEIIKEVSENLVQLHNACKKLKRSFEAKAGGWVEWATGLLKNMNLASAVLVSVVAVGVGIAATQIAPALVAVTKVASFWGGAVVGGGGALAHQAIQNQRKLDNAISALQKMEKRIDKLQTDIIDIETRLESMAVLNIKHKRVYISALEELRGYATKLLDHFTKE